MGYLIAIVIMVFLIWMLIKLIPILFRFIVYSIIALPIWIVLSIFIPGILDEAGFAIVLLCVAIYKSGFWGSSDGESSSFSSYILNIKSKIIHDRWSSSAKTISEKHKKPLTTSEANDLVNSGKYRFRK